MVIINFVFVIVLKYCLEKRKKEREWKRWKLWMCLGLNFIEFDGEEYLVGVVDFIV